MAYVNLRYSLSGAIHFVEWASFLLAWGSPIKLSEMVSGPWGSASLRFSNAVTMSLCHYATFTIGTKDWARSSCVHSTHFTKLLPQVRAQILSNIFSDQVKCNWSDTCVGHKGPSYSLGHVIELKRLVWLLFHLRAPLICRESCWFHASIVCLSPEHQ